MVTRDLSFPETQRSKLSHGESTEPLQVAPVSDRFIAFILDFLILSPVVSFSVAGILRNLKTVLILNSDSDEAVIIWALFVVAIVVFSCLLQGFFLYFWQATPGQKFMQLQVLSYPRKSETDNNLSYAQSVLRPLGWWMGVLLGGVPFLEIVGHPLRRAFHERATDTVVVSLKKETLDLPLPIESRYISSTMWIFFGFLFLMGMMFMGKSYKSALKVGLMAGKTIDQASCSEVSPEKYHDQKRLDIALALYFAEEVDETCVYTEAQNALWNLEGEEKALGQLAMAVISNDEKEAKSYNEKVCVESAKSEACAIVSYLASKDANRGAALRNKGLGLVSSRLLLLKNSMEQENYAAAAGLIRELEVETPFRSYLDKNLVRAAWALNAKFGNPKNSRNPASTEEKEILQEFKKRYEIE
jgi:uncharacterized RDD family membrane protein YckC